MKGIGRRIKVLRKEKGLGQNELASNLGVTRGSVANYESETNYPSIEILYKLCEIFGVTPNDILLDETNSTGDTEQPYKKTIVKTYATRDRGLYDELDALWQEVERLNKELKTCQQTASNLP